MPSRPSPSARCTRSRARRCIRPPSGGSTCRSRRCARKASPCRSRTISSRRSTGRRISSGSPTQVREVWAEDGLERVARRQRGAGVVPARAGALVRGAAACDCGPRSRRGRDRARRLRPRRQPGGGRVPAPRRGAAHGQPPAQGRAEDPRARRLAPGRAGALLRGLSCPPRLRLARPRAGAAPRHAGLPQACPYARRARRPRAAELRRPAHRRLRRPRGPRDREAARLRDEDGRRGHPRLPLPRLPRRRPALRPARADRQGLEVHRRRRRGAGPVEARRQGVAEPEEPRAHEPARAGGRAARALRAPAAGAGRGLRARERVARAARSRVSVPRDRRPAHRDRGRQGGSRAAPPDGSPGLRRRRLRQDRGRRARGLRGRRQRQAEADARPDDRAGRAALEHLPRALPRLSGARRDDLPLPQAEGAEAGTRRLRRRARSTSSSARTACSAAT